MDPQPPLSQLPTNALPEAGAVPSTAPPTADTSQPPALPPTGTVNPTISFSESEPDLEAPALRAGANLDGYVLLEQIGRGGMGIVFKARQPNSEQIVAIKIIREKVFADPELKERFLQEVRALGRLQSVKNIVPIYHVGQHLGCFFFVMPLMAGGSLSTRRKQFPLETGKAVTLVEKLARAVHQLHAHQILHRDIKPSNILLDANEEPHLSDFGLAKLLDQEASLTASHERLGTPAYMAPEQTGLVHTPTSPQTDIWALGVVLYELLVGKRPFSTPDAEVSTTLLWKIVNETPKAPRTVRPEIDPGLEAVILKCLEKLPDDRYASAEELADELNRWLRQETLKTPPISLANSVRRFVEKRPRLSMAVAAGFIVLMAAAIVGFEFRRRASPEGVHAALREELSTHGAVTLVPEEGAPKWTHPVFTKRMTLAVDQENRWRVDCPDDWGLIELLRDVPAESHLLRAEIQHLKSSLTGGRVGIFVGLHTWTHADAEGKFWSNLTFNDKIASKAHVEKIQKTWPPGNVAKQTGELFSFDGNQHAVHEWGGGSLRFEPAGQAAERWRVVELELHPDRIVARFDGEALQPTWRREQVEQAFHADLRDRQTREPQFLQLGDVKNVRLSSAGSLGLVIANGSAFVKNVTLTKILNRD